MAELAPKLPDAQLAVAGLPTDLQEATHVPLRAVRAKQALKEVGHVELPSDYMEPYVITRRMIEDGRQQLVLRDPLHLPFPVRFLQGTSDTAVSVETAVRLLEHATGPDMQLKLVKDADHRFSDGPCLGLILEAIGEVLGSSA